MKYIKDNKKLFSKYLMILVLNVLLFILCNFYFKNFKYCTIILLILIIISDMIIYYYKNPNKFIWYYDFILNMIVGFMIMIFVKDTVLLANNLFSIMFANNIVFMRSRFSDKFIKKSLQYLMILIYTILAMFINLLVYNLIH